MPIGRDGIVEGGRRRIVETPEYKAAVAVARASIDAEFEPLLRDAGTLQKLRLRLTRSLRIRREIKALAPRGALYFMGKR